METTLRTERVLPFAPREIFAAIADPALLARWWGPDGFTNTFARFEFQPGGRWTLTMHGPDGTDYPNENVFREIVPERRVVIAHVVEPLFTLTVDLAARDGGTRVTWTQEFADPAVAARVRAICEPANEQNLDRLTSVLTNHHNP